MVVVLSAALAAALGVSCQAGAPRAADAPMAGASRIALSFGGRIYAMNHDGSGRVRLTGGRFAREDDGDFTPAWSPDGRTLAFARTVYHRRSGDATSRIYLLDMATGRTRRLPVAGQLFMPAWAPDGGRLAFVRAVDDGARDESQLVVAALDGSGEATLFRERPPKGKLALLTGPAWSPDGSRVAFARTWVDRRSYFRSDVHVVSAAGGDARLVARDGADPAWSPDGRRIAFSSIRDRNGHRCYESCIYSGELYAMDADGTNLVRLTRNRGDDRSPSWSPDGRRIVFQSDRNSPHAGGPEIYSIGVDGSCLTWLTNGSPDSRDPDWSAGVTTSSPCSARRPRPVVDVDTRAVRERYRERAYWLGERYRGNLLSHAEAARVGRAGHSFFFAYDDCGRFQASACAPTLQLQEVSVCSRRGSSTLSLVASEPTYRHRIRAFAARGLLFVDIGQHDLSAVVGATEVRMFPGVGGRRGLRLALKALLDLRRVGRPAAPLPGTALPAPLLQRLRRTEQAVERSGSIATAARTLGIPVGLVRRRVELHRAIEALPSLRIVDCR